MPRALLLAGVLMIFGGEAFCLFGPIEDEAAVHRNCHRILYAGVALAGVGAVWHAPARVLIWGDVAFWLAVLLAALRLAPHTRAFFAGIALAALAFPLWIAARVQLGSAFSLKAEARRLVTSGLYAKLRHPVYVFGTLAGLASLLALQIWPLVALALALAPITYLRARGEERVLAAAFGEEYQRYRERTWF
jgi:protein-S-isoprenylcysteine O-methyltransferase Ste14